MKRFITVYDVEQLAARGKEEVELSSDVVITPDAIDRATQLGLRLVGSDVHPHLPGWVSPLGPRPGPWGKDRALEVGGKPMARTTYTRKDIEDMAREGRGEITIEAGARITPEAIERAARLGVRIIAVGDKIRDSPYPGPFDAWNAPHLLSWSENSSGCACDGASRAKDARVPTSAREPRGGADGAARRSAGLPGGVGGVGGGPHGRWTPDRPRPPRISRRTYLTVRDVDVIAAAGEARILLEGDSMLTDEAAERAARLGITVERAGSR